MSNDYPKTLSAEEGRILVALSEDLQPGVWAYLWADLSSNGAELVRDGRSFAAPDCHLSVAEADAFCAAWTAFTMANAYEEIEVVTKTDGASLYWCVSAPSVETYFRNHAYTPRDLLDQVQTCKENIENHLKAAAKRAEEEPVIRLQLSDGSIIS